MLFRSKALLLKPGLQQLRFRAQMAGEGVKVAFLKMASGNFLTHRESYAVLLFNIAEHDQYPNGTYLSDFNN